MFYVIRETSRASFEASLNRLRSQGYVLVGSHTHSIIPLASRPYDHTEVYVAVMYKSRQKEIREPV